MSDVVAAWETIENERLDKLGQVRRVLYAAIFALDHPALRPSMDIRITSLATYNPDAHQLNVWRGLEGH